MCIVGSGTTFISGISYYTYYLSKTLTDSYDVSAVLMRRLLPRFLYPGRNRVGAPITDLHTSSVVPTFDGVDWFALPSLIRASRFVRSETPDVMIFQWWTGTVLHSFLFLNWVARRMGARTVLEFHEDQDTGEASYPLAARVIGPGLRYLIRSAEGFVVHSEWDKERLCQKFDLDPALVAVIPHGPYPIGSSAGDSDAPLPVDDTSNEIRILFFGTIRPYKGAEDLIDAFDMLPRDGTVTWRLEVVGETWEGWDLPGEKIASSPHRADIDFINRYVTDSELPSIFGRADIVSLPYRRSSASGPLHMAMQEGLPVVVTDVGGLPEAADGYSGAVFVSPADPEALRDGIIAALDLRTKRHQDSRSWDETRSSYEALLAKCGEQARN